MRFHVASRLLVSVLVCGPSATAAAQKTDTPKFIELLTDDDGAPDGTRLAGLLTALRANANARDLHWIAASTMTGTLNQTIAIFTYPNVSSVRQAHDVTQAVWQALPERARPRLHSRVFQQAPEQSFGDGLVPWSQATAFSLYSVSVSSGGYDEYGEQQQLAAQLLTKAHVTDEEWLGYTLRYGPDEPAFMFITPLRSIASLDSTVSHADVLPPPVDRARDVALRETVVGSSSTLIVVRPELSSINR
jgi:hypothetical protein